METKDTTIRNAPNLLSLYPQHFLSFRRSYQNTSPLGFKRIFKFTSDVVCTKGNNQIKMWRVILRSIGNIGIFILMPNMVKVLSVFMIIFKGSYHTMPGSGRLSHT
jgi:hypothetical protein